MRDQPTKKAAATSDVLDFLNETNVEITLEKLMETVKKITQPSSELINQTLDDGANTAKFVLLLEQLELVNKATTVATTKGLLEAINERAKIDSVSRKALNEAQSDDKILTAAQEAAHAEVKELHNAKMQLWGRLATSVREAGQHIDTLLKVARSLLQLQETVGAGIRSDRTALTKLTISIKLLDGQWVDLRQRYALMKALKAEIEEMEEKGGVVWVNVRDVETDVARMVKVDVAALSLGFLEAQEDAGDEEEEESDDSRVIDLDAEVEGEEEVVVAVGALQEGENEVVDAGEDEKN